MIAYRAQLYYQSVMRGTIFEHEETKFFTKQETNFLYLMLYLSSNRVSIGRRSAGADIFTIGKYFAAIVLYRVILDLLNSYDDLEKSGKKSNVLE